MHRRQVIHAILVLLALLGGSTIAGPHTLPPVSAQTIPGTIAYVRNNDQTGDEIWLIEPDGSHNRRIWSVGQPDPNGDVFKLTELDWRPDSGEIAFGGEHEQACSIHETDIYAVRPDGGGYRRVTSGPACAALAAYPKGSVSVTVRNFTTNSPLYVYVQGAPEAQFVPPASGGSTTVTLDDVADFGAGVLQQAVVIWGAQRWTAPIAEADVKPGQTVHAGTVNVSGKGFEQFGARLPSWHSDGSRIGWIQTGCGGMWQVSAIPSPGDQGSSLMQGFFLACVMDWGPNSALANQILYGIYGTDYGIYLTSEDNATRGEKILTWNLGFVLDIQWLPDGSGFLFEKTDDFITNGNIYEYSFATKQVTQLTHFSNEFVGALTLSPDGQYIAFERGSKLGYKTPWDVWVMRRNGTDLRLLAQNAMVPSWSPGVLPAPLTPGQYLPVIIRS